MLGLLKRRSRKQSKAAVCPSGPCWPLDRPFIRLTAKDYLSPRDLFEGMLVLGNPGSGKTSTTGTILPLAALQDGWGVVAYTTKPDDVAFWQRLCQRTGREQQLRIIRPDGRSHFNLMRYELGRPEGGNTLQLAALLTEMFREGKPAAMPTDSSEFFEASSQILLCNAIDALSFAGEPLSFRAIGRFIESTAKSPEELESAHWLNGFCFEVLNRGEARAMTEQARELHALVSSYFLDTFPHMNERTRGDILATIESSLFQLNRDPVRQLLDSPEGCSFLPEMLEHGAVLVIDCPVSVYGPVGRMLTICFKRLMKRLMRRRVLNGDATRPILNFCDECQSYVTRDDADFQQVCRSNRVATVFLTQSIDNLEAVLGSGAHTNSLANALTTHVYHCTSGHTAEWVERRIAQAWAETQSISYQGRGEQYRPPGLSVSHGLHPQVLASELSRLRTGGPMNRLLVEAVVFKPGRRFLVSGLPFARVQFLQQ